ncbi:MAG: lipoprotein [Desulfovibrio sp.]|nr:lipoprotein [Desulfovibrio sp.]
MLAGCGQKGPLGQDVTDFTDKISM